MISPAKKEFIEFMMSADVLRFGEFKTKSGRLSPYFVNTGNYKTGAQISTLGKFYAQCIMENCKAAAWSATSQRTATASSSSRMLSPPAPLSAKPFRFCKAQPK